MEKVKKLYDSGCSLDFIINDFISRKNSEGSEKIGKNKARKEVCKIIYNYIMERGSI